MRRTLFALCIPMLACDSTPKVNGGIAGYILTNRSTGLLVTYLKEASEGSETLAKIAQVSSQQLDLPVEAADLTIEPAIKTYISPSQYR